MLHRTTYNNHNSDNDFTFGGDHSPGGIQAIRLFARLGLGP
jgi:hypothetical protein